MQFSILQGESYLKKIKEAVELIAELEQKYTIETERIQEIREQFDNFKVYIPLIGKFSAGKSSLINTLLDYGEEICKENIGVETAFPTEIFYGEEDIPCIYGKKEIRYLSMEEYFNIRDHLSLENTEMVKLQFNNEVLEKFPSIALVDMPGLDSGYEIHDRIIKNYIKNSMAYILVFPVQETTIQASMEPILHDLNTYNMPICVVLTRGNSINSKELREEKKAQLKKDLSRYFGSKEIPIFIAERESGELGGFDEFLIHMEQQANDLGRNYYKKKLIPEFSKVTNYLRGYLKNIELSYSELEEQKDKLEQDIENLNQNITKELESFQEQLPNLAKEVAGDIKAALSQHLEEFVFDLIHNTDIISTVNEIVRMALNNSYQHRIMDNIKKHMDNIAQNMSLGSANYASSMKIDIDNICGKEISGIGRTAIDVIAFIIGGPLGGILAHIFTGIVNQNNNEKRKQAEYKIRQRLTIEVFPAIEHEVSDKVEMDLGRILIEIRQKVEKDVKTQTEVLQKSLEEIIQKKQKEDQNREQKIIQIQKDLKLLEEVQA